MTEETKVMSKEEAIKEVKKLFKGNKKFISFCEVMIASTPDFLNIDSHDIQQDNWNWEKLLHITINTKSGFKQLTYRKGNKRYSPENSLTDRSNITSEIHDYSLRTYLSGIGAEVETYTWNA